MGAARARRAQTSRATVRARRAEPKQPSDHARCTIDRRRAKIREAMTARCVKATWADENSRVEREGADGGAA